MKITRLFIITLIILSVGSIKSKTNGMISYELKDITIEIKPLIDINTVRIRLRKNFENWENTQPGLCGMLKGYLEKSKYERRAGIDVTLFIPGFLRQKANVKDTLRYNWEKDTIISVNTDYICDGLVLSCNMSWSSVDSIYINNLEYDCLVHRDINNIGIPDKYYLSDLKYFNQCELFYNRDKPDKYDDETNTPIVDYLNYISRIYIINGRIQFIEYISCLELINQKY